MIRKNLERARLHLEELLYSIKGSSAGTTASAQNDTVQVCQLEPRILMSASPVAVATEAPVELQIPASASASANVHADEPQDIENSTHPNVAQQAAPTNADSGANADSIAHKDVPGERLRLELVFIDSSVPDVEQMQADLRQRYDSDTNRQLEIIVLDSTRDGVAQITAALMQYTEVDGLHIVSHGSAGQVNLGTTAVSLDNLDTYRGAFSAWQYSLSESADVLFYGCDLAGNTDGQQLIDTISTLTGADVAASDDDTGHAIFGADWELEYATGQIESEVAFSQDVQDNWGHLLNVTVDSTSTGTIAAGGTSTNISHTASGTDRLMLVSVAMSQDAGETVSSVTYNSIGLNFVGLSENTGGAEEVRVEIWSLVAPPDTGPHNVTVNIDGAGHDGVTVGVMTFTGADQTTPMGTFVAANGSATSGSVNVSSAAGELVFGAVGLSAGTDHNFTAGAGQTEHWDLKQGKGNGSGSTKAGAATVSTSYSWGATETWAVGGVSIKAAAAVNAAPVLTASITSADYNENDPPLYDAFATVTDADSTDFDGGTYTLSIAANGTVNDRLGIRSVGTGPGQISTSGSNVLYEGTTIGTFAGGDDGFTPLVVSLNSNATVTAVQTLVRSGTFSNVSDDPVASTRTVRGVVSDGDGGTSVDEDVAVTVIPSNDAPVAVADPYNVNEDNSLTVATPGILTNDSDAENDTLTARLISGTSNGVLMMTPTGAAGETNLTSNAGNDKEPHWSSDGSQIVFRSNRDGNDEIYIMNADGSGQTRLTNTVAASESFPRWSPDGTKIVFTSDRDGNDEIYVMDADGSNQTRLTSNAAADSGAIWSSDGTQIAFRSDRDGDIEVYLMDADGSNQTRLTTSAGTDSPRDWSPDGTKILFNSARDGNNELYVMDADGSNQTRLTTNAASDTGGSYAPDGSRIAFRTDRDGNPEIYMMDADGTNPVRLTTNAATDGTPSWSPDGSRILYHSDQTGDFEILSIELESNGAFTYTPDAGFTGVDSFTYQAHDGALSSSTQTVTITVDPVNNAPTITLPGAMVAYTENDAATVIDATATASDVDSADFDTGTLTVDFTANGTANDRLAIRNQGTAAGQIGVSGSNVTYEGTTIGTFTGGTSGSDPLVITFNANSTPTAAQALMRNVTYANVSNYPSELARNIRFVLTDGDGGSSNAATQTVTVAEINDPLVITSNGGGATAAFNIAEGGSIATTVEISDADVPGQTIFYSITGGSDAASFSIDANGVLRFVNRPDFEVPADADGDNVYLVTVEATDGTIADTQNLTITIEDRRYIERNTTFSATTAGVWEVFDLSAAGFDVPADVAAEIAISTNDTGNQRFGGVREVGSSIERRVDIDNIGSGGEGVGYTVLTTQTDAMSQIEVYSEDPSAVSFTLLGYWESGRFVERYDTITLGTASTWVDQDLNSFGVGADQVAEIAVRNNVLASARQGGVRADGSSLDRRIDLHPTGFGGESTSTFLVQAGSSPTATVELFAENTGNIEFRLLGYWSEAPASFNETFTNLALPAAGETWEQLDLTASGLSGNDVASILFLNGNTSETAAKFGVRTNESNTERVNDIRHASTNGGVASFSTHVNTDSSGTIEWYEEKVGGPHSVYLTGYWSNSAPAITSNGGGATAAINVAENTTTVTTVTATDADLPGDTLTYSITGGPDAAEFTINSSTGELTFASAPDFETPTDADTNNVYEVTVQVSDGAGGTDSQAISVTVTNAGETLIVDTTLDILDGNTSSISNLLSNKGADGFISLREAIIATNNSAGADSLVLSTGTYALTIDGDNENAAMSGDLDITDDLTITGAGVGATVLDANLLERMFEILSGTVSVSDLTIENGLVTGADSAGAIDVSSSANVTLTNVLLRNNQASAGGAIDSVGTLTLVDVTIDGNTATAGRGGGLQVSGSGTATLTGVTISNNTALGGSSGGGIDSSGASLVATNVTISGNSAGNRGAGMFITGNTTLQNVTVTNNNAPANQGAGIFIQSGTVSIRNTLVAGNTGSSDVDVSGTVSSLGNNLIGSSTGSSGWIGSDILDVAPLLSVLADNGGPTYTHALLSGSRGIDEGSNTGAPGIDQRGQTRDVNADIGAYELVAGNTAPIIDLPGPALSYTENDSATVIDATATVTDADSSDFDAGTLTVDFTANGTANDRLAIRNQGTGAGQIGVSGGNVTYSGVTIGTFTGGSDGSTPLIITFNASSTPAAAQALMRNITFENVSDDPSALDRTVRFILNDGDGGVSNGATQTVILTDVNDASSVSLPSAAVSYTENDAATVIDTMATASDVDSADFDTGTLTIDFTANGTANDRLAIRNQGTGAGQIGLSGSNLTFEGTTIGTFTGGTDGATPLVITFNANSTPTSAQALMRNITFENVSTTPSGLDRTIRFVLTDGDGGTSSPATKQVTVSPVATILDQFNAVSYAGNDGELSWSTDWIETDNGGGSGPAAGLITVDGGKLRLQADVIGDNIYRQADLSSASFATFSFDYDNQLTSGDNVVVEVFDGSTWTSLHVFTPGNTGTGNLSFDISAFTASDTQVRWRFDVSASGDAPLFIDNVQIDFTSAVSAPQISLPSATPGYTENDAATIVDSGATASDVDSADLDTGTLTIDFPANGTADDRLAIRNQGTGAGQIGVSGANVSYEGTTIGTFAGGTDGSTPLIITFNASSTPTAAQALMRNITFENVSEDPIETARSVRFVLTDGDGGTSNAVTQTVNVTAVNDAPIITSNGGGASASVNVDENSTAVTTVMSSDVDGGTAVYSIIGGADAAQFAINSSTGELTFTTAPDFETPTDAGTDNVYDVTVQVSDGTLTDAQAISVTMTPLNDNSPTITNDGGGPSAAVNVAENSTAVTTVTATDADLPAETLTYSIIGGADAAQFAINSSTGELTFSTAPDFETPTDAGTDNVYDVTVQVSDGTLTDTQAISVTVTPLNDNSPTITSNAGGPSAAVNVAENSTAVTTVTATDADLPSDTLTYSIIGGADAAQFSINSTTGELTFTTAPDFEAPSDTGTDNVYDVTVQVSDGTFTDAQVIAVTVTNASENAPVITSNGGGASASLNVAENSTAVTTVTATDADLPADTLTYSIIGGADAAQFAINSSTGELTFTTSPDFETPTDTGTDNVYDVTVQVSDGTLTDTQAISVTVTNVNEEQTLITNAGLTVSEGDVGTMITSAMLETTDVDNTPGQLIYTLTSSPTTGTLRLSGVALISGNTFTQADINTGQLTYDHSDAEGFSDSFDFSVDDGVGTSTSAGFAISVNPVNDNAPVITSDGGGGSAAFSVTENSTAVTTVTATDADLPTQTLTYAIVGGADSLRFSLDALTGDLTFSSAPDFESPADADGDNVYHVVVEVSDGLGGSDQQTIQVTVTDVDEFDIGAITDTDVTADEVPENAAIGTNVGLTALATDSDATAVVTYTLDDSAGGRFAIDATAGIVTVAGAIDYENAGSHTITVRATSTDGSTTTRGFTITVLDVNEAPVAGHDAVTTRQLELLDVPAGVLTGNDFDVDGDSLTVVLAGTTANGTLVLQADGSFTYLPDSVFSGIDSFRYYVTDGVLNSSIVTVTIDVQKSIAGPSGGGGTTTDKDSSDTSSSENPVADSGDVVTESSDNETTSSETVTADDAGEPVPVGAAVASMDNGSSQTMTISPQPETSAAVAAPDASFQITIFLVDVPETDDLRDGSSDRSGTRLDSDSVSTSEFLFERITTANPMFGFALSFRADANAMNSTEQIKSEEFADKVVVGTTAAVSTSLSVGYVVWMLRGGSLLTTFLSSMPAWQAFDPLPVLQAFDDEAGEDDDESLASLAGGDASRTVSGATS